MFTKKKQDIIDKDKQNIYICDVKCEELFHCTMKKNHFYL